MSLPRSTPSAQGVDALGVLAFLDAAQARGIDLHSLVVARHGRVVASGWWSPYAPGRLGLVYSISKSLVSTAVGFLVQEGRLGLGDPILRRLPNPGREFHERWRHVTVRHCLDMTVGHDQDAWGAVMAHAAMGDAGGADWVRAALEVVPDHEPGTAFAYNQLATYLLSVAVTHVTGERVVDVLRPRLFAPLGFGDVWWHTDARGRDLGFSGAHVRTDDLVSFAQFCLDRGRWQGRALLDESWFDAPERASGPPNRDPGAQPDWRLGYASAFWRGSHGYRGDGAYGQFLLVLPERDAVVVITSEHTQMQEVLDLVWQHLLPALGGGGSARADAALADRLESLAQPALVGGALGREFAVFGRDGAQGLAPSYAAVSVRRDGTHHVLGLERDGTWLETIRVGDGVWLDSSLVADGLELPVVASGGWVEEDVFRAEVLVVETPHRFAVEARVRSGDADLRWRAEPLTGRDPMHLAVRPARRPGP